MNFEDLKDYSHQLDYFQVVLSKSMDKEFLSVEGLRQVRSNGAVINYVGWRILAAFLGLSDDKALKLWFSYSYPGWPRE